MICQKCLSQGKLKITSFHLCIMCSKAISGTAPYIICSDCSDKFEVCKQCGKVGEE